MQNWNHVASIPGCANHQPQLFLLPACYCGSTRNSLIPKPLKLLSILAKDGLTLKESAQKLCIGVDTANKHVAAAKQSLGASTLANAVYLAATHDLLIEEDETPEAEA